MGKTHVVMLLDESSSMTPHRSAVVSTLNEYVATLKAKTKRCWISLFKFAGRDFASRLMSRNSNDNCLEEVVENRRVDEFYSMTEGQYHPCGWTPLHDAIGMLIQRTKKRLPKEAKVLFVIHTDGQENTSRKYTRADIKRMIAKCEKKRGWTFVYLGEGAAAWNAGYDFGVDNVANYSSSLRGASMQKFATATVAFATCDSVGGANGTSKAFYKDAGLDPDDIDPSEITSVSVSAGSDSTGAENG